MIILYILIIFLIIFCMLIAYLTITEYKPKNIQKAEIIESNHCTQLIDSHLSICSWNIGYAGLGNNSDLFMDGGKMINPPSKETVQSNLDGIKNVISKCYADIWMLQEIDINSNRTGYINQLSYLSEGYNKAFTYNYKCKFVPIPFPPIGKVESGIAMLSKLQFKAAIRLALPNTFKWPGRIASLKRCLLEIRYPIKDTNKELVLYNLHLEAYGNDHVKSNQFQSLLEIILKEYAKGNYVIAGGDFNHTFPKVLEKFKIHDYVWIPQIIQDDILPKGWQLVYDLNIPSCRLLNHPYDERSPLYILDGFIASPNIQIDKIENMNLKFEYSDHNPVKLEVTLLD